MSRSGAIVLALLVLLVIANIGTGAALVMTTTLSRSLFQEYVLLKSEEDRLRGDWSAFRIEVTRLAGHSKIDAIARDELGMVEPDEDFHYIQVVR
jgi:cell division protein FtsL